MWEAGRLNYRNLERGLGVGSRASSLSSSLGSSLDTPTDTDAVPPTLSPRRARSAPTKAQPAARTVTFSTQTGPVDGAPEAIRCASPANPSGASPAVEPLSASGRRTASAWLADEERRADQLQPHGAPVEASLGDTEVYLTERPSPACGGGGTYAEGRTAAHEVKATVSFARRTRRTDAISVRPVEVTQSRADTFPSMRV